MFENENSILVFRACRHGGRRTVNVIATSDRRHDVEGAAEEGLPAIAVEWGYAHRRASWRRPARYGSSPTSKHCAACCSETNKRLFFSEIFRPDYNPKPHPFGGRLLIDFR